MNSKSITIKTVIGGELMFPSNYLSAIEFKGRDVTLTIRAVEIEKLQRRGGKSDPKPVLSFDRTRKKLVLNKTNASSIAEMYGPVAEQWIGKRVTFFPTKDRFGKQIVDAIRIRVKQQPSAESDPVWSDADVVDETAQLPDDILAASEESQSDESDLPQQQSSGAPSINLADDDEFREELIGTVAGKVDEAVFSTGFKALLAAYPDANASDVKLRTHTRLRILMAAKADRIDWASPSLP